MSMLRQACADCGQPTDGTRCERCAVPVRRAAQRRGDARRPNFRERGYDSGYDRDRRSVIGGPCELRLPGCTGIATTADHVIPISQGGRGGQLRGACLHCNSARGNRSVDSPNSYPSNEGPGERHGGASSPSDLSIRAGVRA